MCVCVCTLFFKTLLFYLSVCVSTCAHICTGMHVSIYELSPSAYISPKVELDTPRTRLIGGHDLPSSGTGNQTGLNLTSETALQPHMRRLILPMWNLTPKAPHAETIRVALVPMTFRKRTCSARECGGWSHAKQLCGPLSLSGQQHVSSFTVGWLEFQCRYPKSGQTVLIIK